MDFAQLNLIIKSEDAEKADQRQRKMVESGKQLEDQTNKVSKASQGLEGVFSRMLGLIAKLSAAYASMRVVWTAVSDAAKFESLQIVFAKLTGNGEVAKNLLLEIQRIADNSTLEFTPLANAAKRMLALGTATKDVIPLIETIGEAVSVLGEQSLEPILDAFSKMSSGMKITTREMQGMQLQGVPAWDMLAKAIGETRDRTMELVGSGAIGGRRAMTAFLANFRAEYGGTMKMLDNSTEGLFTSLRDNLQLMLREMGTGLIETFDARGKLAPMVETTEKWRGLLGDVVRILGGLNPKIAETAQLAERLAKLAKALGVIALTFVAWEAGLKICTIAMWAFNAAAAANPILFILATATASMVYFADKLVDAGKKNRDWGDDMIMIWEAIAKAIRGANDALRTYLDADKGKPNVVKPGEEGYNKAGWKYPLSWAMGLDLPVEGHVRPPEALAPGPSERDQLIAKLEAKQMELSQAAKRERDLRMGEGPGRTSQEDEYFAKMKQMRQMQEDLDQQLMLLGKTNDEREVEAAKLRISRLELRGVDEQTRTYIETLKQLQEAKKLQQIADDIGDAFSHAFEDAILGAQSFAEAFKSMVQDIERAVVRSLVTKPLGEGISGLLAKIMGLGGGNQAGIEGMRETSGLPGGTPDYSTGEFGLGGVFSRGRVVPFAGGGVVGGPTYFPMASGGVGLMGEAGPEAVMPLKRGRDGKLGVSAGRTIVVHIHATDYNSFKISKQQLANDVGQMFRRM